MDGVFQLRTEVVRVALVHSNEGSLLSRAVQVALSSHSTMSSLFACLQGLLNLVEVVEVASVVDVCPRTLGANDAMELLFSAETNSSVAEHTLFSKTVLGLEAGQNALISNGKVYHDVCL